METNMVAELPYFENREDFCSQCIHINLYLFGNNTNNEYNSQYLTKVLAENLDKKVIIYTNTPKKSESIKENMDEYINANKIISGDTMLIQCSLM